MWYEAHLQQKLLLLGLHCSKVEESCIFDNAILFPYIFICRNNTLKWKKEKYVSLRNCPNYTEIGMSGYSYKELELSALLLSIKLGTDEQLGECN